MRGCSSHVELAVAPNSRRGKPARGAQEQAKDLMQKDECLNDSTDMWSKKASDAPLSAECTLLPSSL
jgi:hypothetical protein